MAKQSGIPSLTSLLLGTRTATLVRAGILIVLIALADWKVEGEIPLGFLYLFPMLLVGSVCERWQIGLIAALCTFLTEQFDSFAWFLQSGLPRNIMIFAAFFCTGLFVHAIVRSRQLVLQHLDRIEKESAARREAEEQMKVLIESSPAAVFTTDGGGSVLLANDAAHRLFGLTPATLPGQSIRDYLPALVNVPALGHNRQTFRTVMQCRGRRRDGEVFLADVWFSTYATSAGPRLAAMVVDTSEELRSREELGLHQLLVGSRILVDAVSHEVRNVCGAIAVVHQNLARSGALASNKDFEALGTLILALEKIASMELRQTSNQAGGVDLQSVLDELRIIMEPSLRDAGVIVHWSIEPGLPAVWADRQSLMQVFLNLVKNSERALRKKSGGELTVSASLEKQRVEVRIQDTGGGVPNPDQLFRPFQPGAETTGLGLYLSRAFMRSFRGDLRYQAEARGASFIVELSPVLSGGKENYGQEDRDSIGGRSQLVSGGPQPAARG